MKIIDAHCHFDKFSNIEIKRILNKYDKDIIILTVSEDLESSIKNLTFSKLYENIIPAIGIHPWKVDNVKEEDIKFIEKIVKEEKINILGEIGLDKKFKPDTYEKQKEIFEKFLKIAKDYDLKLNLHAPNAWDDVFNLLIKYDIKKAYFHWYSGDEKLLEEIEEKGYFIGINVSALINKKYEKYIEIAKIDNIITESDGPYEYKGIILHPEMIEKLYDKISEIKKIKKEKLYDIILNNFSRFVY
ncbi:MAG: TatD family hydrolase [Nanopusillaceae archaeon]|jgi:TatD DNase family protein